MTNPCQDCNPTDNPCAGVGTISWDAAITSCLSRLGVEDNQALSVVISSIAAAVCTLMDAADPTCSSILISTSYENIQFTGTDSTTLCDLDAAIDTRFGNILNEDFSDCFGDASTLGDAITQIREKLCTDLYTNDEWVFLPLAGNSNAATQQFIIMASGGGISWYNATLTGLPTISASTSGLSLGGGLDAGTHVLPIEAGTPIKKTLADHQPFSVLTAATVFLDQDTMLPQYFIDKSTVVSVYLPGLASMVIDRPVVTFTAEALGVVAGTAHIYPDNGSGETIQGAPSEDFSLLDFITLVGDKNTLNWKIISFGIT